MTSSPDDRTDQVDDPKTPPAKTAAKRQAAQTGAGAAKKSPVKRAPAAGKPAARTTATKKPAVVKKPASASTARTNAKSAAEKAAANAEVVIEPVTSQGADAGRAEAATAPAKKTAAAARTAAARNTAARAGGTTPASPRAKTTGGENATSRPAAAKSGAVKSASAQSTAAKSTAAKSTAAKTTAAKSTAAKTAAAKAAAAKAAETKSTARTAAARTASAKTVAARTAAAKSAASKAAAAKAAEDAQTVVAPVESLDAPVESLDAPVESLDAPVETVDAPGLPAESEPEPAVEAENATAIAAAPATETTSQDDVADGMTADIPADASQETTDTGASATERIVAEVHEVSGIPAISIRGLVKHFGDNHAVDGIDLTVPAGSFYGIVGPNGAGKTTTLSIVAGLLRADEGTVEICGIDQAAQPLAAKRVMGVLPDRLRTFDRLTGRQLLYYYGLLRGLASSVIEKRTADLARAFDLQEALSRVVSDYSAGMTKKLMLAGAMIHSPRVLVLDEPFESVDPVSSAVILDILRAYVAHGGTVILSSHGMDLVERVCSRVAIIVGGEVLAEGTIDEVRAGQTLEARFVELSGGIGEVEGLEWLHMFSD